MKTIDKVREELSDIRHYYANIKDFERVSTEIGRPSALEMVERYNRHIKNTYIVQESIFMNFDVIQLTFNKDGKYMVIPVVNSPIDVYNDLTLPNNGSLGLKQLLIMVLGLVLLAVILFTIVPLIVKGVGSLIKFPFREQEDDKYMHDHMEDREE